MNLLETAERFPPGCPSPGRSPGVARFEFLRDTFAFSNETKWRYHVDPRTGRQVSTPRIPLPKYVLRCFTVARATRQFWQHARFDPRQRAPGQPECRRLIHSVLGRCEQTPSATANRVVLPGFSGLRDFSANEEALLKRECGGPWRSYLQRGNWRMVFPFTRGHQEREATRMAARISAGQLPIIHVVRFPQLTINHALLLFGVRESAKSLDFRAYDPNVSDAEVPVRFDRESRTFSLPPLFYFAGGRVDVYEIYRGWVF